MSSREQSCFFIAWNIHKFLFLPSFYCLFAFMLLMMLFGDVINFFFFLLFFNAVLKSLCWSINEILNPGESFSSLVFCCFFFFDSYTLCHLSYVNLKLVYGSHFYNKLWFVHIPCLYDPVCTIHCRLPFLPSRILPFIPFELVCCICL